MSALSDALNEANVDQLSVREIARRGGDRVHHSALGKYFKPNHPRPGEDVLEVFSEVLRIPMRRLRQLAELPPGANEPYVPPKEANRLSARQRRLVDDLIRVLAEARGGEEHDRSSTAIVVELERRVRGAGGDLSQAALGAFDDHGTDPMVVDILMAIQRATGQDESLGAAARRGTPKLRRLRNGDSPPADPDGPETGA